ncbi:hypothetical protein LOTGIDRAFT_162814 [Lottia gigantea]|uniref:Sulfotransferase domain-containing protein n=1 Tax=Lottia gigantea TaxID=225164 RepID=V4A606_LOTGI|nr:hypothetical protein LOTGIDRAFT_162814 [Lottia gigantea]ESO92162.1 hypothetical protein LOTGIDRAFT_162814 [Lottia gigantea]
MSETVKNSKQSCSKVKNIAFLKAHKCGSTTASNILQRFGLRENLNFVLPDKTGKWFWVLGHLSSHTVREIIPLPKGEVYNILSVDTVFNKTIYQQLIPNPFYLTIMRDPVERFVSGAYYSISKYKSLMTDGPYPFQQTEMTIKHSDFVFDTSKDIYRVLEESENDFNFVMITEYFDESLVLLKYELCWSTKDIVYITRNVNKAKQGYALSPEDRTLIERKTGVYKNVYDHFKMKLFQEIISHGTDFLNEVFYFKIILKQVHDYCKYPTQDNLQIPSSKWNEKFTINTSECHLMNLTEFPLVSMLQERQRKKLVDEQHKTVNEH